MTPSISYVMDSPALSNQRGINFGRVYMQVTTLDFLVLVFQIGFEKTCSHRWQDGTLAVSVAQEALIRLVE